MADACRLWKSLAQLFNREVFMSFQSPVLSNSNPRQDDEESIGLVELIGIAVAIVAAAVVIANLLVLPVPLV
jgi:hypothetical protein